MISYESSNNGHCLRLGGETTQTNPGAGLQICFGTFEHKHPCSVALNGKTTVYTGVMKATSNTSTSNTTSSNDEAETPPVFYEFPKAFAEAPLTMASPNAGAYWFNDALANASTLSRVDFCMNEKHTKANPVNVSGNYIAIGKYGSTDIAKISTALAASDIRAYWNEASNAVRILGATTTENGQQTVQAVQIVFGNLSVSGKFKQFNTSLYRLNASINKAFSKAFSSTPAVFAAPSMKCRDWADSSKFSHPYWFGGISATSSEISTLSVYTNADYAKTVYGRYIAIGLSDNTVTGWDEVPISLTQGANGGYALRFGNDAGGMQLAFGDINFNDRKIQKPLNDVASNIYTAFKEAPAYEAATDMYFPKAFCESPSTVIMTSKACRTNDSNGDVEFLNPYWFGDAASDAVSIFNTDLYTNKAFTTDQDVYAKYLAVGRYSAKADWARPFILKALSYKGADTVDSKDIQTYFLDRYDAIFNHTRTSDNGWCSEFASVVLHESMQAPINEYPYSTYVKRFIQQFSYPDPKRPAYDDTKVNSGTSKFYLGTYDQKTKTTAFHLGKIDSALNEHTYYHYGDTTTAGNDLRFSCTELGIKDVTPQIGDLIFFGHSKSCHTGIVINVNGSHIFTVEGNVDEKQLDIGTSTKNTVLHVRRKISADSSKTNKDRVVGIGDVYACHAALKAKLNASKG